MTRPGQAPLSHLIRAAVELRRTPAQIAERLTALGYSVPDVAGLAADLTASDVTLISRSLGRQEPWLGQAGSGWLDPAGPAPLSHLIRAAVELRRTPAQIAERLTALGYSVPDVAGLAADLTASDVTLISRSLGRQEPWLGQAGSGWLDPAGPAPLSHLIRAAVELRRTPAQIAERLTALGYSIPNLSRLLPKGHPGGSL